MIPDASEDVAPGTVGSSPAVGEVVDGGLPPAAVVSSAPDRAAIDVSGGADAAAVAEPGGEAEVLVDDKASEVAATERTGAAVEEIEVEIAAADDEPAAEVSAF